MPSKFCPVNRDHHNGPFLFGERLGIFLTVLAAMLSAISASGLLIYVVLRKFKRWKARRHRIRHSPSRPEASGVSLLISLVVADLVQAVGGMPTWIWMLDARVTEGPSCTLQGAFLNVGNVAIAFSSLSIAVHTFVVLILHWRITQFTLRVVAAGIWFLTALIVLVCSRARSDYYGDTDYWCWITEKHCAERFVGEYLWMWIAFFTMIGLYVCMFILMLRNTMGAQNEEGEDVRESRKMAYSMLYYPAVYLLCVAPVSISRWYDWTSGKQLPPAAPLFSNTVFSLSGFLNLILFSITRPTLITGDSASVSSRNSSGELAVMEDMGERHSRRHPSSDSVERAGAEAPFVDNSPSPGEYQRRSLRRPSTAPHIADPDLRAWNEGRLPD